MRLTNPLLNRAKGSVDDGAGSGLLPQLESGRSKPPFSAFGVSTLPEVIVNSSSRSTLVGFVTCREAKARVGKRLLSRSASCLRASPALTRWTLRSVCLKA
jgi:hypothetical protein